MALTADKIRTTTSQPTEAWLESALSQNWSRLHAILFRLLGDSAEAEDLTLESFWRLYNQPPAEKSAGNLRGWLYRVAVNLGYNALRARKRRQHYETQAGRILLDEKPNQSPDTAVEDEMERQRVRLALTQMKRRSAQVLVLRYSGLSYAEIAAALEVSQSSVGTLLARAEREFEKRYQSLNS